MDRRLVAAGAALAALLVAVVVSAPAPVALSNVPQGVSVVTAPGAGRVFLDRQGSQVYALGVSTQRGERLVWCPFEELYWAEGSLSVYARDGRQLYRGTSGRDPIVTRPVEVTPELTVTVRAEGRGMSPPRRDVPKDILAFYQRWLNRANIPTDRELRWCPDPIG